MASSIDLFLYVLLLALFMVFFGIPSIQKYQRKETIVISSRKLTNGIAAPAVTFIALSNDTRYGWKSKTNQTNILFCRRKVDGPCESIDILRYVCADGPPPINSINTERKVSSMKTET